MKLYLMRHGQSTSDLEGIIESRYDAPLTELGIQQAECVAQTYKERGIYFDQIFSSPLMRAKSTAEIVGEVFNLPVQSLDVLMETDRGVLCGMDRKLADVQYPRKVYKSLTDRYPNNTGESPLEARSRAYLALQACLETDAQTLLVVSHGHFLNEMVSVILNTPLVINEKHGAVFSFGDCGYMALNHTCESDRWVVLELRQGTKTEKNK